MHIITTKDGLPQSFVSGLVQDDDGFVWVGTRNGLARYDGSRFKVFHHRNQDTTTLTSNVLISILKDTHNRIWIEHESGDIDVMDPKTEIIRRVTAHPLFRSRPERVVRRGWLSDVTGNLWMIKQGKGLACYDWNHQIVRHYTRQTHGLPSDTIRGLLEDQKQQLWVVSQRGISRFDSKTGQFRHTLTPFPLDYNTYLDSDAEVIAVHERKNGEIMLSDRKQLIFFHPNRRTFRTVPLSFYPTRGIRWIQTGPDGYEYLESEGRVYRYSDSEGLKPIGELNLAMFRDAHSFLIDRSGLIWLGTNAAGIHQIDLTAPSFESHPTTNSFHQDVLRQKLGISLDQFANWPLNEGQFKFSSYFFRSTYDANHQLWIALRDRVAHYDVKQNRWILLPPIPQISSSKNLTLGIRGIRFAPDSTLWAVGYNGLINSFDPLGQKWTALVDPATALQWAAKSSPVDLLADAEKLWVTTGSEGLWCIDIQSKRGRHISQQTDPTALPTNLLLGLTADPTRSNLLWIGSYEGLICLDKRTLKSRVFSTEEGLPDNTIYSIVPDKAGFLWLSTNKGLCRFHPVTHQVRVFQTADGLPGDEFNRFHHLQFPDGRLAFGGTDGWTLFDPTTVKDDNYQPPVAFTELRINNEPIPPGSNLLSAPLNNLNELSLPYDQNSLTFEFAGLEFNQPKKLRYRYQLEGFDDKWIEVNHSPLANYTKLPAGKYTLKVNSTNTTEQWSRYIRTLPVIIKPPFWRTWWAYGFYLLLLAGLIRAYIQYRLNRERLRQEVALKEQEAQYLKETSDWQTRFFTNITHEFRTPLTLIINPLERLLKQSALPEPNQLRQQYGVMHRNARRLLRLINQLLDIAKLEAGHLTAVESRGNMAVFFQELVDSFRMGIEKKGIDFNYESAGLASDYRFDAQKFEIIGYNLLSNALKFTPQGGHIRVTLTGEKPEDGQTRLILRVSDTGIGIPAEQLPHIFDRFFQGHDSPTSMGGGTGIGLFLVNELTKLLGGQVEVESQPGQATTFTVTLPLLEANGPSASVEPIESLHVRSFKPETVPELAALSSDAPTILVVEDNDDLRDFIAQELAESYRVLTAVNGQDGWEKVLAELPDLVISDVMMPLVDGFTLVQRIKNTPLTAHIGVILLTARTMADSRIQGLSVGANDYLTKPFHFQELQLRIANLVRHQQQLRKYWQQQIRQPNAIEAPVLAAGFSADDPFLLELYEVLDKELSNATFSVEQLAETMAVSVRTLHRKLAALTDMSANELMRSYRLRKAASFLQEGCSVSETAEKVGFEGLSYFSKSFKAQFAVSPSAYLNARNSN